MTSKRGQGNGQHIARWLSSNDTVTNKWLQELIDDVETKYKCKLDKLMNLHSEAEDEVLNGHSRVCTLDIDPVDFNLHPPVAALMNLILKDPGEIKKSSVE